MKYMNEKIKLTQGQGHGVKGQAKCQGMTDTSTFQPNQMSAKILKGLMVEKESTEKRQRGRDREFA